MFFVISERYRWSGRPEKKRKDKKTKKNLLTASKSFWDVLTSNCEDSQTVDNGMIEQMCGYASPKSICFMGALVQRFIQVTWCHQRAYEAIQLSQWLKGSLRPPFIHYCHVHHEYMDLLPDM